MTRDSGAYPFRQWAGVCCPAVEGGVPEWRDLLLVEGGTDHDRAVAGSYGQKLWCAVRKPAPRPQRVM